MPWLVTATMFGLALLAGPQTLCNTTVLSPNYAIKRDRRETSTFK